LLVLGDPDLDDQQLDGGLALGRRSFGEDAGQESPDQVNGAPGRGSRFLLDGGGDLVPAH